MVKRKDRRPSAPVRQLMTACPRDANELHRFVRRVLGLDVPRQVLEPRSTPPFSYLTHTFFEPEADPASTGGKDCVVWANRGGGKTLLGAVATLLDLVFKPGIEVRILGGSLAQSAKMYEHLSALFDRRLLRPALAREPTQRRIELTNGSVAEILAQSQKAVRGLRVHKLRCDEIEQFDPDLWQAAQLVTRSGRCGEMPVTGAVEALSTLHRPGGLMEQLIGSEPNTRAADDAEAGAPFEASADGGRASTSPHRRVFRWNALDVIARCEPARACDECVLWHDCGGRAKEARGFVAVSDLVAQWHRTSADTWAAEMLCQRPRRADSVYPNFDPARHVAPVPPAPVDAAPIRVGGMDFGLRSPTVFLWAELHSDGRDETLIHVIDEYVQTGLTLEQHLRAIEQRAASEGWSGSASVDWVGIDPAGRQRSSHSGLSDVEVLRRFGHRPRSRTGPLRDGIERVRRRLDHGALLVHPRCAKLIEALRCYHFDGSQPARDEPVKDGPDHACDALRYLVVNLERAPRPVTVRQWA